MWVAVVPKPASLDLLSDLKGNQVLLERAHWASQSSWPMFRSWLFVVGPWTVVSNLIKPLFLHLNMGLSLSDMLSRYKK